MTSNRKSRTDEELSAVSEHVLYEVEMLCATARYLETRWIGESSAPVQTANNAVLESWVLHLRNLLEFLYGHGGPRDHVRANDFFEAGWQRSGQTEVLRAAQRRANKEIAHISYDRNGVTATQKGWDIQGTTLEVARPLREFADAVPVSRVCKRG